MEKSAVWPLVLELGVACGGAEQEPAHTSSEDRTAEARGYYAFQDDADEPVSGASRGAAANVRMIISPQDMPVSENGVFTEDGRFFVVGQDTLYEVVATGPDSFAANVLLKEEDCYLGGMTDFGNLLYVTCMPADLVTPGAEILRIDPSDPLALRVERAPFFPGSGALVLLNGMDFGPDGALYTSNSLSFFTGDPAVYRVEVSPGEPFAVEAKPFIEADLVTELRDQGGGLAPNGIRFHGDDMYLSRGYTMVRTRLRRHGSHGPLSVVYSSESAVDDFCIVDGMLWITEVNVAAFFSGGLAPSQVKVLDLHGDLRETIDVDFIPSSTAGDRDTLFGPNAIVVTSYFNGGLYRILKD